MSWVKHNKLHCHNIAIIVAAGHGTRFSTNIPKQFALLCGFPVLRWTIEAFISHPMIDAVCVAIAADHIEIYNRVVSDSNLNVLPYVVGGTLRQHTVRYALEAVSKYTPEKVLIHDAVRPLVTHDIITNVVQALDYWKAVDVALPIIDTVKCTAGTLQEVLSESQIKSREERALVDNNCNKITVLDRRHLYCAQTPQGFNFSTILHLYRQLDTTTLYTDEASICIAANIEIGLVLGNVSNHKITFEEDMEYMEYFLTKRLNRTQL